MKNYGTIALVLLILLALPAAAHPHNESETVQALQEEIDKLRSEVATLRLENSNLRKQLAAEEDVEQPAEEPAAEAEEDPQGQEEQEEQAEIRTYTSADEMLRLMPQKLKPKREGWTRTEVPKVKEWLADTFPGNQYSARKKVRSISVSRTPFKETWDVKLTFEPVQMRYMSWEMQERLVIVKLTGDDVFVEQAERKYKAGRRVQVSGEIDTIAWDFGSTNKYGERWHPTYIAIDLKDVEVR